MRPIFKNKMLMYQLKANLDEKFCFVIVRFGILRIPPFVNHKGNDVNSNWLTDQWNERTVLGHAHFHKERMKGNDQSADSKAQTPKRRLQTRYCADSKALPLASGSSGGKSERISLIVSRTSKVTHL